MASNVTIPPPHSRRVEAWIYGAINPLIDGIRREVFLLDKGNLSWRWYSRSCEYIRPIPEYIESSQRPNYDDFLGDPLNAAFTGRLDGHDRLVRDVEGKAKRFFDGLMQSNLFREQVKASLEEYESRVSTKPQYPSLDSTAEDLPKYVAEYLINRRELLPYHYTMHKFWEEYRRKFESYLAGESEPYQERQSFRELGQASDALKNLSTTLLNDLEEHRRLLCSKYDIPAAPIAVKNSHSEK